MAYINETVPHKLHDNTAEIRADLVRVFDQFFLGAGDQITCPQRDRNWSDMYEIFSTEIRVGRFSVTVYLKEAAAYGMSWRYQTDVDGDLFNCEAFQAGISWASYGTLSVEESLQFASALSWANLLATRINECFGSGRQLRRLHKTAAQVAEDKRVYERRELWKSVIASIGDGMSGAQPLRMRYFPNTHKLTEYFYYTVAGKRGVYEVLVTNDKTDRIAVSKLKDSSALSNDQIYEFRG